MSLLTLFARSRRASATSTVRRQVDVAMEDFLVARNPDAASKLPFLLRLPLLSGMWIKAKESWPRSSRVFCHPAREPIDPPEVLERVAVVLCRRNGPAIDLVLDRGSRRRSQFVLVEYRGRRAIFWQTPKAARSAKPGLRIPFPTPMPSEKYYIDARERFGYTFTGKNLERRALPVGDYAVMNDDEVVVAAVERKTIDDFFRSLDDATLSFEMAELAALTHAAVVVEGSYSEVVRHAHTTPGYLPELIARLTVLYPHVPIHFLESRRLAEQWVLRFLRIALANSTAVQLPLGYGAARAATVQTVGATEP